jgi:hypothetical protein
MIGSKGVPITAVVTEMRFDTEAATPKITFKPVRVLDSDEHNLAIEQGKTPAAIKAITMTVSETDNTNSAPKLEAKATAVVAEVAVEAVVEEPTKRVSKKDEAPAPKKDISKILSDWDDA